MKKATILLLFAGGAVIFLWLQHQGEGRMRAENSELREQLQQLAGQNQQLSNQLSAQVSAAPVTATETERELMKLRGEMNRVRRELAEAQTQLKRQAGQQQVQQKAAEQAEASKELAIAKLNYTKGWMVALFDYAQQHEGKLPPDLESATSFATEAVTKQTNLAPEQFEIVYNGSLNDVTNSPSVIVIREKQPLQSPDGAWFRSYGFADGHSEIHKVQDGNFEPWEAQHTVVQPAPQPGQ